MVSGFPKEERVIAAIDKDLLTIPGRHFNWRKESQAITEVDEAAANYNFMHQTLCGDRTDGYPGLPGCGPVKASKILEGGGGGLYDMWIAVVEAFKKKELTAEDALLQARCARILRAEDWDFDNNCPILWEPKQYEC
jgi:DNA polymerase-1